MFRPILMCVSAALCAVAYSGSALAGGDEWCHTRLRSLCSDECHAYMAPSNVIENECDMMSLVITIDSLDAAPADPSLQCTRNETGYLCEAWPQGEEISYSWSESSTVATDARNPFRQLSCGIGSVSVAVIGPSGAASTATADLPACN